jgi:hypothetical protein
MPDDETDSAKLSYREKLEQITREAGPVSELGVNNFDAWYEGELEKADLYLYTKNFLPTLYRDHLHSVSEGGDSESLEEVSYLQKFK